MDDRLVKTTEYKDFIESVKSKIQSSQIKAAVLVNVEFLKLYWDLAQNIVEKQQHTSWGDGFIEQISKDLKDAFPNMKGFSKRNILYMKKWFLYYTDPKVPQLVAQIGEYGKSPQLVDRLDEAKKGQRVVAQIDENGKSQQDVGELDKVPQLEGELDKTQKTPQSVAQIFQIPWGHNREIITKCKMHEEALFYVNQTVANNWSRAVLVHQIEFDLFHREGKALSNFETTLPAPQSDLAKQILKDPYVFDFLDLQTKHDEKELEDALIDHVAKFLRELGIGFSYIGRQYRIEVAGDEFFIDLLFYHVKLHCFVVVELKTVKFVPEFAGKLNFYVTTIDEQLRDDADNATIGLLICKSKNKTVVEYSLKDIQKPIGVSEYIITKKLPKSLQSVLPSIEEIEAELKDKNE